MWIWLVAVLVSLLALAALVAALLGLPGTWLMVGISLLLTLFAPESSLIQVPWVATLAITLMALLGEGLEFLAGMAGVGKLGGSQRSAWLALLGSVIGAIVGLFVGLPIPVVGSLVTSVLLGGLGAAVGAVIGERWVGKDWSHSTKVGGAAFAGRLLGTLAKSVCAGIMLVILVWQVWV